MEVTYLLVNKERLRKLMNDRFDGNYNKFARALDVNPAQLYRILENDSQAGALFLGKLMSYCNANSLDFEKYIFLPKPLTGVNTNQI